MVGVVYGDVASSCWGVRCTLYGVGGSREARGSCTAPVLLAFFLMAAMLTFFSTSMTVWRVRCTFGGGMPGMRGAGARALRRAVVRADQSTTGFLTFFSILTDRHYSFVSFMRPYISAIVNRNPPTFLSFLLMWHASVAGSLGALTWHAK